MIRIHKTKYGEYNFDPETRVVSYTNSRNENLKRWKIVDGEAKLIEKIGPGSKRMPKRVFENIPD
jgi:hypothetical protein